MTRSSTLAFTGAFRDTVTAGLPLGNGYRWYLPALMRFNAPDSFSPFGAGGRNPYVYCKDDPINRVDPTGHVNFPILEEEATQAATETSESTRDEPISVKQSNVATDGTHGHSSVGAQPEPVRPGRRQAQATDNAEVLQTVRARKKAVSIPARTVGDKEVEVTTLEGKVMAPPGSYIMTGINGEEWPILENELNKRYTYEPKTGLATPKGVEVIAKQMRNNFRVMTNWAPTALEGQAGDFLVTVRGEPNNSWPVAKEIFDKTYEILSD